MTSTVIMVIVIAALNAAAAIYKEYAKRKAALEAREAARGGARVPPVQRSGDAAPEVRASTTPGPARSAIGGRASTKRVPPVAPAPQPRAKSKSSMRPRAGWPGASAPKAASVKPPPLPPKPPFTGRAVAGRPAEGRPRLDSIVQAVMARLARAPQEGTGGRGGASSTPDAATPSIARSADRPRRASAPRQLTGRELRRALAIGVILEPPRGVQPWGPPVLDR
jgi:hypothetical protein